MSKIGFTVLRKESDPQLSLHFGKAKWLMIVESQSHYPLFLRNPDFTGRSMILLLHEHHCDDVVFSAIGPGALKQLKQAQIGGWFGLEGARVSKLLEMFGRGQLRLARKAKRGPARESNSASSGRSIYAPKSQQS